MTKVTVAAVLTVLFQQHLPLGIGSFSPPGRDSASGSCQAAQAVWSESLKHEHSLSYIREVGCADGSGEARAAGPVDPLHLPGWLGTLWGTQSDKEGEKRKVQNWKRLGEPYLPHSREAHGDAGKVPGS